MLQKFTFEFSYIFQTYKDSAGSLLSGEMLHVIGDLRFQQSQGKFKGVPEKVNFKIRITFVQNRCARGTDSSYQCIKQINNADVELTVNPV